MFCVYKGTQENDSTALAVGVSAAIAVLSILIIVTVTILCVMYRRSRKVVNKKDIG